MLRADRAKTIAASISISMRCHWVGCKCGSQIRGLKIDVGGLGSLKAAKFNVQRSAFN